MIKTFFRYLKQSFKNPLFFGSLVMVVGTNLYSVGQFVYHSVAIRTLGEAYYGDLAAIISVLGLLGIIQLTFNLTIVRFVAQHHPGETLKNFVTWINWWSNVGGAVLALLFLAVSPFLAGFLHLHQPFSIYLLPPMIFLFMVAGSARSVLQGLLRFRSFVLSMLSEVIVKIIFTVVLVYLSYALWGAMIALLFGTLTSYLVTLFYIRDVLTRKRGKMPDIKPIIKFSIPVFIQGIALTSMYSLDLLLVKHFFNAYESGIYASIAVLGRVAFFVSGPIAFVMFPLITRRHSESKPYGAIFILSAVLTASLSFAIVLMYKFFPGLFLVLFSGHILPEGVQLLWWFSLFMAFISLDSLTVQFYLSIGKTWVVWLFVGAALLQVALIWFIHPSLLRVIQNSILSAALLAASLFLYFPYHKSTIYKK